MVQLRSVECRLLCVVTVQTLHGPPEPATFNYGVTIKPNYTDVHVLRMSDTRSHRSVGIETNKAKISKLDTLTLDLV